MFYYRGISMIDAYLHGVIETALTGLVGKFLFTS
jgi:hypothetical protein